jgi:hypothetical protein
MNNGKMCTRVMLVWVLLLIISLVDAQVLPPCADQILLPCIDYVNSTKPPYICCNPIKDLYATDKTCFCQLFSASGLFEAFGLKITQVFRVIHLCGINFNISSCIGMWNENIFNTSSVLNRVTHWKKIDPKWMIISFCKGILLFYFSILPYN